MEEKATRIQNWRAMASSKDPEVLQTALELAASIKDAIQDELLFWFVVQKNWGMKMRVFELLDGKRKALADEMSGAVELVPVNVDENFKFLVAAMGEAEAVRRTVIQMTQDGQNIRERKAIFKKMLRDVSGMDRTESRRVLEDLWAKVDFGEEE